MTRADRYNDSMLVGLALAAIAPVTLFELSSSLEQHGRAYVFFGLAAACGLVGLLMRQNRRRPMAWLLVSRAVVLGSLGFAAWEVWAEKQVPVVALGHFVIGLGAAKFLELVTPRDRMVVVVISLLSLVIGAMVSADLVFGLVLAAYLSIGLHWLMRFQLSSQAYAVWDRTLAALGPAERRVSLAPLEDAMRRTRLAPVAMAYGAALLVMVTVLFLAVPRELLRQPLLPVGAAGVTGFSSQVDLARMGPLLTSEQGVMRVELRAGQQPVGSPDETFYLRGASLNQYYSGQWFNHAAAAPATLKLADGEESAVLPDAAAIPADVEWLEQRIRVDQASEREPYLFAIEPALFVASGDVESVLVDRSGPTLTLGRIPSGGYSYRVRSPRRVTEPLAQLLEQASASRRAAALETAISLLTARGDGRRRRPLNAVERMVIRYPRVAELAEQVVAPRSLPVPAAEVERSASAIEAYLLSQRFEYSLDPRGGAPREDPVERFLFESRRGYCVHFASAMALMCQSLGVPARFVVGYRTRDFNEYGQFYRVLRRDAHAWVEVRVPGRHWVRFDPTPALPDQGGGSADGVWASVRRGYDYLQSEWTALIVSFDAQHRRELIEAVRQWWTDLSGGGPRRLSWGARLRGLVLGPEELSTQHRLLYWFVGLLLAAFATLIARAAWIIAQLARERMSRWWRVEPGFQRVAGARFYERLLLLLERRGLRRPPGRTPLEFARELARRRPELAAVERMTEWYYEVQYGGRALDPQRRHDAARLLDQLSSTGRLDGASGSAV